MALTVLGGALALASVCAANDGAITGVGGTPKLMRDHPSVRLVSEEVRIRLPEGKVEAKFIFRNDGPATDVVMGFPESGGGDISVPKRSAFDYFESYVDGQRVKVARVGPKGNIGSGDYRIWWVKRVHFNKGQQRVVVNRYQGGVGGGASGVWFEYILATGASWKGRIGSARVICNVRGLKDCTLHIMEPSGYRIVGSQLVWEFHDFEPDGNTPNITVGWWSGFWDIVMNGNHVLTRDLRNSDYCPDVLPRKKGNDVVLQINTAAVVLGAEMEVKQEKPPFRVRLTRGTHWVELQQGSKQAETSKGRITLPQTVQTQKRHMIVQLRPLVSALGGEMKSDTKKGKFMVSLPKVGK